MSWSDMFSGIGAEVSDLFGGGGGEHAVHRAGPAHPHSAAPAAAESFNIGPAQDLNSSMASLSVALGGLPSDAYADPMIEGGPGGYMRG